MSKMTDFLQEKLQEALNYDEDTEDSFKGGLVASWIVIAEVMPSPDASEHSMMLLTLKPDHQRSWTSKGMLMDALDWVRQQNDGLWREESE